MLPVQKYSTPVNFLTFEICWFGCVMGAASNLGWLGALLVLVAVPLQVYFLTDRRREEALFVLLCGLCGFVLETLMIIGKVYIPAWWDLPISPLWMLALWINFGPLVAISLSWLKGKYLLAAIVGGLAGPVAYWGGDELGALTVSAPFSRGYLLIGIAWTLVLPSLVYLHTRLTEPGTDIS
jgi:hypothetical protein